MAIKHVKETLGQFQDAQFFTKLFEGKEDEEDKKFKEEESKDAQEALKKLRDNLNRFETAAGGKILKYKEFWEENQEMADQFDEEGDIYKLWDSDYVAGVLNLPDEALTDDELNAEIEMVDQAGGDEDKDEETTDEAGDEDDDEKPGPEKGTDYDEEEGEVPGEQDTGPDEYDEDDDKDKDEDELEEGNAFSGALAKAKKEGKKEFKVGGKTYPVKESDMPEGEEFVLNEMDAPKTPITEDEEDDEGELPAEDVVTPEEASPEEEEEAAEAGLKGFEAPGEDLDGDGIEGEGEVEVEDGEAVELDGDLDGDGEEEGGMEFAGEPGTSEYFVIYDMSGSDRDEVFRTDDPKVIEEFKNFFQNEWKAAIRAQIQQFKEAQEEKRREAERKAKEEIRKERKAKLDKFMKD